MAGRAEGPYASVDLTFLFLSCFSFRMVVGWRRRINNIPGHHLQMLLRGVEIAKELTHGMMGRKGASTKVICEGSGPGKVVAMQGEGKWAALVMGMV